MFELCGNKINIMINNWRRLHVIDPQTSSEIPLKHKDYDVLMVQVKGLFIETGRKTK